MDDILIMDKDGIPYYFGCFNGETCKKYPEHNISTTLIPDLFNFMKKHLNSQHMKAILLSDSKITFTTDEKTGFIVAYTSTLEESEFLIKKSQEKTLEIFQILCKNAIDNCDYLAMEEIENFERELILYGIVKQVSLKNGGEVKERLMETLCS